MLRGGPLLAAPTFPGVNAMAKHGPKPAAKAARVMREFSRGTLRSGSKKGPQVTAPAQAKAIAMSEARRVSRAR